MREKISKEGFPLFTTPTYIPVDNNPFEPKLTPVDHLPEFEPLKITVTPKLVPVESNPFQ